MNIASPSPNLRAPQDWRPTSAAVAAHFAPPLDLADLVQRAMDGDLQVLHTLDAWDGQGEPPVGDDR